jgi:hypothetical protein
MRWLAAVGLTATAEDIARVDTAETNAMALLGAHAACEALLGLLAGVQRHTGPKEVFFWQLLEEAKKKVNTPKAKVRIEPDMADDLDAMHQIRNAFVHASNTVSAVEAERAISNARRLLELVPAKLAVPWRLPAGAGLGTAVAEVISVEAVGMWLRHADDMQRQRRDRPELATDGLARALDAALIRTHPAVLNDESSRGVQRNLLYIAATGGRNWEAEETQAQIDRLYQWVLPLALGTSPVAYQRLRDVVGRAEVLAAGVGPCRVFRPEGAVPSMEAVRGATSQTAEIIFRLWAMGSLEPRHGDDQMVAAAQSFIANPSGPAAGELSQPVL